MMWQRIYQGVTHNLFFLIVEIFAFNLWTCVFLTSLLLGCLLLADSNFDRLFHLITEFVK